MSRSASSSLMRQAHKPKTSSLLFSLFAPPNIRLASRHHHLFSTTQPFSNSFSTKTTVPSLKPTSHPSRPILPQKSLRQRQQRAYSTIPPSPDTSSPSQQQQSQQQQNENKNKPLGKLDQPSYSLTFTCRPCTHRSSHTITKQAYHHGTVLIQCPSCKNRHLIADHLKIFSDKSVTLEDILKQRAEKDFLAGGNEQGDGNGDQGEKIKYGSVTVGEDGRVELFPEGWSVDGVAAAQESNMKQ